MKRLIVILFAITLASCKKDDAEPSTKTKFLTPGTWMVSSVACDEDGDGTYDTYDYADCLDCFKDNIYTFHSSGTRKMNEGASKCDPGDPQTESSTWQLTNNDSDLNLANDVYSV